MRLFLLMLGLCGALRAAEAPQKAIQPQTFVVGLSPFLDDAAKDDIYRSLVRLIVEAVPLNSTVSVYDAFNLKTIVQLHVPESHAFESAKTRANQFASPIRELREFLAQNHARPADARLKFQDALLVPQFYQFLNENLIQTNRKCSLLLIGSPLYQDPKEPAFSMIDGYFPSDGHLQATREKSVYGLSEARDSGLHFAVDWAYFGDPWLTDLYREKVTRFWSLFFELRGSELRSFSADLTTATRSFYQGKIGEQEPSRHWAIDSQQTKVEMMRIGREIDAADWIQRDAILDEAQHPPSKLIGPMKIGIRWKQNIDLDLYASPRQGAETLFFQHPRSAEGYYYKDHRSSPGKEFEFIEFETPVDVREVEAFVNFYKGDCPGGPGGEVRIEFENKIYSALFSISASEGNRGRAGQSQQQFWVRLPVQEILKLTPRVASQ